MFYSVQSTQLKMSTGGTFNISVSPAMCMFCSFFYAMSKCSDFGLLRATMCILFSIAETEVVMVIVVLTSGSPSSDCNMIVI